MTVARITQTAIEVLVQEDATVARLTQAALEVLVQEDAVMARVSQAALEVLRRNHTEGAPPSFALIIPAGG